MTKKGRKWTEEQKANLRQALALRRKRKTAALRRQDKNNIVTSTDVDAVVLDATKSLGRFIAAKPITLTFKSLLFQLKRKRAFLNQAISSLEELVKEEDTK